MLDAINQFNPLWFSLGPLLFINVFGLFTVLVFAFIRKKNPPIPALDELEGRHHSRFLNKWLKEYWFWVTAPIEKIALKLGLTPNFFTTFGFVLSCLAGYAFYYGRMGVAGWCVIFAGTCDMFDGRIARITQKSSASGAFYDSVMDRFGELASLVGLAAFYRESWIFWFVIAAIIGSMMVSYTRARGQAVGIDCQGGVMQRPERIVYLGVGSIFSPIFGYLFSSYLPPHHEYLVIMAVILIAIMTSLTAIYRTIWIYRRLDDSPVTKNVPKKDPKPAVLLRHTGGRA
jgi:CDP-diacylglycerol--glycerol-3-phosphate 3-phosphatidyltransferase